MQDTVSKGAVGGWSVANTNISEKANVAGADAA